MESRYDTNDHSGSLQGSETGQDSCFSIPVIKKNYISGKQTCNSIHDNDAFSSLAHNVTIGSESLDELLKITGCKRNWLMTEYTVRDMGSTKGLYGNDNTSSYVVLVILL